MVPSLIHQELTDLGPMTHRDALRNLTHIVSPYAQGTLATVEFHNEGSNRPIYGISGIKMADLESAVGEWKAKLASTILTDSFHEMDADAPALFLNYYKEGDDLRPTTKPQSVIILTHDAWAVGGQPGAGLACWLKRQAFEYGLNPISTTPRVHDLSSNYELEQITYADLERDYPEVTKIMDIQVAERYLDALKSGTPSFKV
jgi:hypothetical protein